MGGLTAKNLNVATTEELKSIRVEKKLSGNKEAARWMDIRVLESTVETVKTVLRIH